MKRCIVVGAGMAGLVAGSRLNQAGMDVTVLDKGRGPGGRISTRPMGQAVFDYGAQYLDVMDTDFSQMVGGWVSAGAAKVWSEGFVRADAQGNLVEGVEDVRPRYCGSGDFGMRTITNHLASSLRVVQEARVTGLKKSAGGWCVEGNDHQIWEAEAVLLTPPMPQTLALLEASEVSLDIGTHEALKAIDYSPCFTWMGIFSKPSLIPAPGGLRLLEHDSLIWLADNHQKGLSPVPGAVTIQTHAAFGRVHFEDDFDRVDALIREAARPWTQGDVIQTKVHRWRYSFPNRPYPEPFLAIPAHAPLFLAGDSFGGPRIEGAALSGLKAAETLLAQM